MAERAPEPQGFDLDGARRDLDERARRWAPVYAQPDVLAVRLIGRNPGIAPIIRQAIEAEMAKLPGGGVPLSAPLYPLGGGAV
jgi:hypothetical protein